MSGQQVLVVAPHPDDDIIGCGGSIVKHLKRQNEVFVIYVTNGDAECSEFPKKEFREKRKEETSEAASRLGLKQENLYFMDKDPWELEEKEVRFGLMALVRKIRPDVCYIPHSLDGHVDHRIVSRAALDALSMAPGKWFRKCGSVREEPFSLSLILAYEVWSPLEEPNYFEDISMFLKLKKEALGEHRTQAVVKYEFASMGMSAFRGSMREGERNVYVEAFHVIKIRDIFV